MQNCSFDTYLEVIARGAIQLHLGCFEPADWLFRLGQTMAQEIPTERGLDILPLYYQSLLRLRQGRRAEAQELREQASSRLEQTTVTPDSPAFHGMMATVLMSLGEYRRAIPFWEKAIELKLDSNDPESIAGSLAHTGKCYSKCGLRDHAVVPLRAAVKIFRNCPGDPRLVDALITLGNALRKSSPGEAEQLYKEAAELYTGKGQWESATAPWVNLGVVCSEQGRHEEALDYYQRALRVREASPATPPDRLAMLWNNTANCYRRMGKFTEAFPAVDRAITLVEPAGDSSILASAYGTRGLIYGDAGRDAEAAEWLQKAWNVNRRLPSPNLETMVEDLQHEIGALERLGRVDARLQAEERLHGIRAEMQAIRPKDCHLDGLPDVPSDGAVLIEMGFGSRSQSAEDRRSLKYLLAHLGEVLSSEQVGYIGGNMAVPENTTIILYGEDGEGLFRTIEPVMARYRICDRAVVTIRQGGAHRTVVRPGLVN